MTGAARDPGTSANFRYTTSTDMTAATFVVSEATQFLARDFSPLDACFSIFGALGHCEPAPLLRAIHRRLRPGGRLLFSVRHPLARGTAPSSGRRAERLRIGEATHVPVVRYDDDLETWTGLLTTAGYQVHTSLELGSPRKPPCCLLFVASRAVHRAAIPRDART